MVVVAICVERCQSTAALCLCPCVCWTISLSSTVHPVSAMYNYLALFLRHQRHIFHLFSPCAFVSYLEIGMEWIYKEDGSLSRIRLAFLNL